MVYGQMDAGEGVWWWWWWSSKMCMNCDSVRQPKRGTGFQGSHKLGRATNQEITIIARPTTWNARQQNEKAGPHIEGTKQAASLVCHIGRLLSSCHTTMICVIASRTSDPVVSEAMLAGLILATSNLHL
jgi:hypothetical protein